MADQSAVVTPIDRYLAEQRHLTAVERFARHHDAAVADAGALAPGSRWYADRLPTARPAAGQQYGFRVDLDRCSGCKACVAACHALNGLDDAESWRSVGLLVGRDPERPRQQTVPTGCHHCVDPACLSGCPTNAYEKDPVTGIVRHLDDQCIGCSYCELACPYEVPKLNERLGIVRKCDLCADRLAEGEAPACVQACPTSAITIDLVDIQQAVVEAQGTSLVPGAPSSSVTVPTTRYVSRHPVDEGMVAADDHTTRLSRSHPPLVFMLVLTQLSVGAFIAAVVVGAGSPGGLPAGAPIAAALAGLLALAGSVAHLGRPLAAWRAVLGITHSWLSREIVAFGAYAALAVGFGAIAATGAAPARVERALGAAGALAGVCALGCSAMVYVATGRGWWATRSTALKFGLTALSSGPLFLAAAVVLGSAATSSSAPPVTIVALAVTGCAASAAKLSSEAWFLWRHRCGGQLDLGRTAALLLGPLRRLTAWRFALGLVGGVAGPAGVAAFASERPSAGAATLAVTVVGTVVAGELIERYQFFVASAAPRMPGGFRR